MDGKSFTTTTSFTICNCIYGKQLLPAIFFINKFWGCGDNKGYIVCEVAS
jgi:hypothetical protein